MSDASEPLRLLAWSRIWSPLVPDAWRAEAWRALGLPGSWPEAEPAFWSTFQVGLPAPRVPLLLHALVGGDGARAREDWLRVASHLGLEGSEHTLPPDHLGVACEVLACALRADEPVLVRELCARYLRPWCASARAILEGSAPKPGASGTSEVEGPVGALAALPALFDADLARLTP